MKRCSFCASPSANSVGPRKRDEALNALARAAVVVLLASLLLAGLPPGGSPPPAEAVSSSSTIVRSTPRPPSLLAEINEARAAYELPKLKRSKSLSRSSRRYARWMARSGYFGHLSPIRASRSFRGLGENIGHCSCRRYDARWLVGAWLRSATHRRVLLTRHYRYVGASSVRWRGTLVVAQFGRR